MKSLLRQLLIIFTMMISHLATSSVANADERPISAEMKNIYIEAARSGDPNAMYQMGLMYLTGNSVSQNEAVAVSFLNHASRRGSVEARSLLAATNIGSKPGVVREISKSPHKRLDAKPNNIKKIQQQKQQTIKAKAKRRKNRTERRKKRDNKLDSAKKVVKLETTRSRSKHLKFKNPAGRVEMSLETSIDPSNVVVEQTQLAGLLPKPAATDKKNRQRGLSSLILALMACLAFLFTICAISLSSERYLRGLYWIKVDLRHRLNLFFYNRKNIP